MATNNKMWEQKEKRELFAKCVNSILMHLPEGKIPENDFLLDIVLEAAKKVIDTAFENYPSPEDESEPSELDFKK